MKNKITNLIVLVTIVTMGSAFAQDEPQTGTFQRFVMGGPGLDGPGGAGGAMFFQRADTAAGPSDVTYKFISAEMSFDGTVVKGAPFSADAATETTQVLADGNRIVHKNSATLYRDAEGRTRREQTLEAIGPWTASGDPVQLITINDPVAGLNYFLNTKTHVAHKLPLPNPAVAGKGDILMAAPPLAGGPMFSTQGGMGVGRFELRTLRPQKTGDPSKSESLGQQTISGVVASGTRTTLTIPAGQVGNERPIDVVSERWYSEELKTVVMTTHTDPRMGMTTYQLTNIRRESPSASLFEVPSDYTIEDAPGPVRFQQKIQK